MADPNINVDPESLRAAAQDYEHAVLGMFEEQLNNYTAAHGAISAPRANWFGGVGGTGRVQEASTSFLTWLAAELEKVITEKKRINDSFRQHINGLNSLANNVQAADEAAQKTLKRIAEDFRGVR